MDRPLEVLTFSRGQTFSRCRKLAYWKYERCLRPIREDDADSRQTGTAMHVGADHYATGGLDAGLAAIKKWMEDQPAIGDDVRKVEQQAARACAMLRVLSERWPVAPGALAEHQFAMPIVNPETGAPSRTFIYRGKCDQVEGTRLVDWKGVSDTGDFIRKMIRGFQVELYAAGLEASGIHIEEAEYRLVTFPSIKYCSKDASLTAYENRCVEWLRDDPTNLVEHVVMLNPARVELAKAWLWDQTKEILAARQSSRWTKNGLACKDWNRLCEFDSLCTAEDMGADPETIIANQYQVGDPNPELATEVAA